MTGSFFENSPGPNCVNFSSFSTEMSNRASSLKTDVCIMVYENTDCEWRLNHSVKIPPGEHPDLAVFHHSKVNFDNKIGSFKVCAQDQWGGGDIHNVYLSGTTGTSPTCFEVILFNFLVKEALCMINELLKTASELANR